MIVLDIETATDEPSLELYNLHKPVAVPKNYRKPESIKAYVERELADRERKAALNPYTGRVISIGIGEVGEEGLQAVRTLYNPEDERPIFLSFWKAVESVSALPILGFNLLKFDLPFILTRSMKLGIKPSRRISLARYNMRDVVDLMQWLSSWGSLSFIGLKQACAFFDIKNPLKGISGAQVKDMSEKEILAYQENDIRLAFALYTRMRGYYV